MKGSGLVRHTAMFATLFALAVAMLVLSAGATAAPAGDIAVTAEQSTPLSEFGEKAGDFTVVPDYKHDVSPPLRTIAPVGGARLPERANPNRRRLTEATLDEEDTVVQEVEATETEMGGPLLNFDGVGFPGVNCNCAPPDTDGEVGLTQYVQIVNTGFQVYDKFTGAPVLPEPVSIATLWSGFGGVCEFNGNGDPIVLYDQLADRWLISQFAGSGVITDECIAISTSSDAAGSYNRYGFHLGTNFFDYPKIGVWPDAYYMAMNIFNAAATAYLGPQPFAFDRDAMLAGEPATYITPGITNGPSEETYLPADLDGSTLPPAGAPNTFVEFPCQVNPATQLCGNTGPLAHKLWHFDVDFEDPASSSFTLHATVPAAPFTFLCPTTAACIPQEGTTANAQRLDAIADRLMFRAAYRNYGTHESLVSNYTVCVSTGGSCTQPTLTGTSVAGVRWFELRDVSTAPVMHQEGTYAPDTTSRWMGSAAMDKNGNLALGYSASGPASGEGAVRPQVRYAGRSADAPLGTLDQAEVTVPTGTNGGQTGTGNRWGDYSAMSVDPVDDCTFWYTQEYYPGTTFTQFNWRTRIVSFRFDDCEAETPPDRAAVSIFKTADSPGVAAGGQIGFTVRLQNTGTLAASGLSFTDNLPAGAGIDWTIGPGTDAGWSVAGSPPSQSLVYSPTTLDAGAATQAHVVSSTSMASAGAYTNTASFTADNGDGGSATAVTAVLVPTCDLDEGFDSVAGLPAGGWAIRNNSQPGPGSTSWFQGNPAIFAAHSGAASSYVAANFNSGTGVSTLSNWLMTPLLELRNGSTFTFWTRRAGAGTATFPDRLQVRMSINGASTDIGDSATSVGDFTTLLLDINPTYSNATTYPDGYPNVFTQFTVTVSGLSGPATGRLAFRHFVENGGPSGSRSNFIGIDTVSYDCRVVRIAKTADEATVAAGAPIGFTVTLQNNGTDPATGLTFSDPLPGGAGVNWTIDAADTDAGWSVSGSPPSQSLVYTPTTLAAGSSTKAHVTSATTTESAGTYTNTASFTAANGDAGSATAATTVLVPPCDVQEGFDSVADLVPGGWAIRNNSQPGPGTTSWFQGVPGTFPAHSGAPNSYVSANFNSGTGVSTLSNWLMTPVLELRNGSQLTFWTRRTGTGLATFPDRLQVRLSTNGGSTNVGGTATSVGDFTTLLLDINPTYSNAATFPAGYPNVFTQFTVTVSGLPGPATGRLAFRYFVENGGPSGARSNVIGIDTLSYDCRAVKLTKTADAPSASPGSQVGFTVTLRNDDTEPVPISFTDPLPAGIDVDWTIDPANTDAGWSVLGFPPNQTLVYSPTTLAGGSSTSVHVVSATTSLSCGTLANTASHSSGNDPGSASASVSFTHVSLAESFDGVTAPALPDGWTATNAVGPAPLWVTDGTTVNPQPAADSPPNAAWIDDPAVVSDKRLESPPIPIGGPATLTFRHRAVLENTFDGGVLEISIDGGPFQDILAAGGSFVTGGYNATISSNFGNPIGGRSAWTGTIGTTSSYVTVTVNLPAAANGKTVVLRWRMASDNVVASQGWRIDDVTVRDAVACGPAFPFAGFFAPISNTGLNAVTAGQSVSVKFSLGGNQGLDILAPGSPTSQQFDCTTHERIGPVESSSPAGKSGLSYNAAADQYAYAWKSDKAWKGTCRVLSIRLSDNTVHSALFRFR